MAWTRLVSVAMAFVVMLASVIGMTAHAAEHRHIQGAHHAGALADSGGLERSGGLEHPDARHGDSDHDADAGCDAQPGLNSCTPDASPDASHTDCGDLICHCGWTIGDAPIETNGLRYARLTFGWHGHLLARTPAFSFDRPPKPLVYA